ncbi:hypothetical protein ACMD2_00643 [Ananas comosus]|uniref:Uncharacterized protein n=1 Tax=Ananas comosus TaxID=4615 RepID=A0A199VDT3_ANACO|nr:hypothetical protein ACMD2_00643 [Ananas comosus]
MCSKLRSPAAAASWIAACSSIFAHPIRSTFFFPLLKALPSIGIPKSHSMQVISQLPTISIPSTAGYTSSLLGYSIFPQLQGFGFCEHRVGFHQIRRRINGRVVIGPRCLHPVKHIVYILLPVQLPISLLSSLCSASC